MWCFPGTGSVCSWMSSRFALDGFPELGCTVYLESFPELLDGALGVNPLFAVLAGNTGPKGRPAMPVLVWLAEKRLNQLSFLLDEGHFVCA